MSNLKAVRPVLYLAHQYGIGDTLPVADGSMVNAWLEAGSAVWTEDEAQAPAPKAKAVTAPSGMPGISSDGDTEALTGKITPKPERETDKRKRKS